MSNNQEIYISYIKNIITFMFVKDKYQAIIHHKNTICSKQVKNYIIFLMNKGYNTKQNEEYKQNETFIYFKDTFNVDDKNIRENVGEENLSRILKLDTKKSQYVFRNACKVVKHLLKLKPEEREKEGELALAALAELELSQDESYIDNGDNNNLSMMPDVDGYYSNGGKCQVNISDGDTEIGEGAFSDCIDLTSVTIPNSVTSIGEKAFYGCIGLTSVTIPNSVTEIGEGAFDGCIGLTSVFIPITLLDKIEKKTNPISDLRVFPINTVVSKVDTGGELVIEDSVTSIEKEAFFEYTGLTSVTIPNSVTEIGDGAFSGCIGLTSVKFNKDSELKSIGDGAFFGCSGLNELTIPDSVTTIGEKVFIGCSRLTSVTIGNSVTSIGASAFHGCSGLTSVIIPDSVTSIGASAFFNCFGLTSVTIPDSVTSIGEDAFHGCSGLTSVKIGNSVTSIGTSAFDGCSGLKEVFIPDSVTSIGDDAFHGCSGLTSVTIPDSVTSIGEKAFIGCSGLTSVFIPDSVTSIGNEAFYSCSGLTSVVLSEKYKEEEYKDYFNSPGDLSILYYNNTLEKYALEGNLDEVKKILEKAYTEAAPLEAAPLEAETTRRVAGAPGAQLTLEASAAEKKETFTKFTKSVKNCLDKLLTNINSNVEIVFELLELINKESIENQVNEILSEFDQSEFDFLIRLILMQSFMLIILKNPVVDEDVYGFPKKFKPLLPKQEYIDFFAKLIKFSLEIIYTFDGYFKSPNNNLKTKDVFETLTKLFDDKFNKMLFIKEEKEKEKKKKEVVLKGNNVLLDITDPYFSFRLFTKMYEYKDWSVKKKKSHHYRG